MKYTDNAIFTEDLKAICAAEYIPWHQLKHKTLLVTGGTGLIGSTLIRAVVFSNAEYDLHCKILALVRDPDKAREMLDPSVELIVGNVEHIPNMDSDVDYIIHTACPTASAVMVDHPVEVIKASVLGTINLLELAVSKGSRFLYLSSMEAYGTVKTNALLDEDALGYVNPLVIRSCYPESKRMCEAIVAAYAKEYNINAFSVRLAQTFGPGIKPDDKRVFAMMARCAANLENIVLQTKGESRHPYLYTADAVTAILTVLLKGEKGKCYNAANPDTYCSVYEMGEMVASELADNRITISVAENGDTQKYPDTSFLNLGIMRLKELGWNYTVGLKEMYVRMMEANGQKPL